MKTDAEYINQYPSSEPLRQLRASILSQLVVKKTVKPPIEVIEKFDLKTLSQLPMGWYEPPQTEIRPQ